jgi:glucosamine 6-phosphate synthetase-like amidotransferase/phosphosugar isomerase protein
MLHGTWGFAILCSDKPDEIYCTTNGSPLLIGKTDNYAMIVSEQSAFSESITNYIVLKNMDICVINNQLFIETRQFYNKLKQKTFEKTRWSKSFDSDMLAMSPPRILAHSGHTETQ